MPVKYYWYFGLVNDKLKGKYVIIEVKPNNGGESSVFAFPCTNLCGQNLKRPHLSCLSCAIRQIYYRKMAPFIELSSWYITWIPKDTPRWRKILAKKLLSLAEFIAHVKHRWCF